MTGEGEGNEGTSTFFLLPLSVTFANNSIGNACYAGYFFISMSLGSILGIINTKQPLNETVNVIWTELGPSIHIRYKICH